MKTSVHRLVRTSFVVVLSAVLAAPGLAQTREQELRNKEAALERREADLERQRAELEAAKKQLRFDESAQRVTMYLEGDVLFDFEKAALRPEAQEALEKVAAVLALFPGAAVLIEGHTDSIGKPAANLVLSEKRAITVQEFLKQRHELAGITFTTRGLGETRPVVANDTEEGRQRNRRVEIVVEKSR